MWLPIVERELGLASRRPTLYLLRPIAPLVLLVFAVGPFVLYSFFRGQEGRTCFNALGAGLFAVAIFAGLAFTGDCISVERRQGTLPLLQLAGLTNIDVLLGKLAATGIPAFFALISIFLLLRFNSCLERLLPQQYPQQCWRKFVPPP